MRAGVDFADLEREPNVVVDIHVRVEAHSLKHHRHIAVLGLKVVDPLAVNQNVAFGRVLEPSDHPHGRGLATAGRAEKHKEFLISNCQVEIVDTDK